MRSTVVERAEPGALDQPDLEGRSRWHFGWSELVTGPITAFDVPGEHLALLRKPAVDRVGEHVTRALR